MCLRRRGNVGCTCACGIIVKKTVCVCLHSEVWRSFKGTCSLQEIQGLVSSAVIQFHRHFQQEDLIRLKMWLAWNSYVLVCAQVSSRVTSVKLSCRNTAPADGPRVIAFKLMVVWMCLGRSVYEDWGFWMHVFMTNGPAIEIPCSTLSIWYDGKRFHRKSSHITFETKYIESWYHINH